MFGLCEGLLGVARTRRARQRSQPIPQIPPRTESRAVDRAGSAHTSDAALKTCIGMYVFFKFTFFKIPELGLNPTLRCSRIRPRELRALEYGLRPR